MDLELVPDPELTPHNDLRLDNRWDRSQSQSGPYIKVKKYNPNMDLELDPDLALTPHHNEQR